MLAQYCNEGFSKTLISNLVTMVNTGALRPMNERRCALIYLPLIPCFFNHAYGPVENKTYVDIRPVYNIGYKRVIISSTMYLYNIVLPPK